MVIGIDFGNINSFPAIISGIDKRTHRGGVDVFLLPNRSEFRLGIPTTFHFKKARRTGEQDEYSFGLKAYNALPRPNRRNLLKRRLWEKETIDGQEIDYDSVITGMIAHIVNTANEELVKSGYARCNEIALAYPVDFKLAEKEHLRQLAEKAVLSDGSHVQVKGMIQEPAAAALEYLASRPVERASKDHAILVYDLGGGTFDAAIVTAHQNAEGIITGYEVLDQIGVPRAGNEFTVAMANLMQEKFKMIGVSPKTGDSAKEALKRDAETLKCRLSDTGINYVEFEDEDDNLIDITRAELERATDGLVTETLTATKQLYDRCPTKPAMIVMTGGQSQMPIIRTRLQQLFPGIGSENIVFYKPQQAIALGAARFGDIGTGPVILRTGKMIGLGNVVDDDDDRRYVKSLIPRNTSIPMQHPATHIFHPVEPCTTHRIYLREAVVDNPNIYNGEHFKTVAELLIDFNISEKQQLDFEVRVHIDERNKIHFSAHDPKGKFKSVSVSVKYTNG